MIDKLSLIDLYIHKSKSMQETANILGYSLHTVSYWMNKYEIPIRSRSDAIYIKCNPGGDPFHFRLPINLEESKLFGIGIGLYWGEGTKASKSSIRLGNTDAELIAIFIDFLKTFFGIEPKTLKFGLQIFTDVSVESAMDFWTKNLKMNQKQFNKVIITKSGSLGTYRKKSQYGVLTVMYHNKKARDLLLSLLPNYKPL